jgi:copper chaperone CopZ
MKPALALAFLVSIVASAHAPPQTVAQPSAATPARARLVISVGGLQCPACAAEVSAALHRVSGVQAVEVSLARHRAVVTYDPARATPARLMDAIREAGYQPGPAVAE